MKEKYQFENNELIIIDSDLGIHIKERFIPLMIPKNHTLTQGLVIKKNDSGSVICAYFNKNGQFEGQYHLYYPEGLIESECYYNKGKLHGPSRLYSESGNCISETWFYQGFKEGKSIQFYLSGELCNIERYKKGVFHGTQEYYYEGGDLKSMLHYQNGMIEGVVVLFWPNGQKKRECGFSCGLHEGYDRMWNSSGQLIDEGHYEKGQPVGVHSRLYEDGTSQEKRVYHTPYRFDCTKWDSDGKVVMQGLFKSSSLYEEIRWIQGVEKKRNGVWKEGRIFWKENEN